MTISLLNLDSGSASLEFDDADWPAVKAAIISQFGEILPQELGAYAYINVEFGGEGFIYYDEFDPCLIAPTKKGADMLRLIAASLTPSAVPALRKLPCSDAAVK